MSGSGIAHEGNPIAAGWNVLTGAPWDGVPRTNATWIHRGTKVYLTGDEDQKQRVAGRWHHLSRLERMAIRWLVFLALAGLGWSYYLQPDETVANVLSYGWVVSVLALGVGGWWVTGRLLTWPHRRQWVRPLHLTLHEVLNISEWTRPESYIKVPLDFDSGGAESIVIGLPANFTGADERDDPDSSSFGMSITSLGRIGKGALVKQVLREKLPLEDKQFRFHLKGTDHWLEILPVPHPPGLVTITNRHHLEMCESFPEHELMVGLSALPLGAKERNTGALALRAGGLAQAVDLHAETPHMGIFARAGAGKSTMVAGLATQVLHNGGIVVFIDAKAVSHKWARGLPGVVYLSSIPDIHNGLILLAWEALRRGQLVLQHDDDNSEPDVGPRILVVVEEVNATFRKLGRYWTQIRPQNAPKESPAVEAYEDVVFTGRHVKQNMLIVGQSGTTRHMGGPEIRENLQGGLILAGWSHNSWRMLVGPDIRVPKPSLKPGLVQFVRNRVPRETQVLFFSDPKYGNKDSELCRWALSGIKTGDTPLPAILAALPDPLTGIRDRQLELVSGIPTPGDPTSLHVSGSTTPAAEAVPVTERHLSAVPGIPEDQPRDELISLSDALDKGILSGPTLAAVRQQRYRHKDTFPEHKKRKGSEYLYSANELAFWDRNRPGTGEGETA